jgi:hypothetical protein
MHLAGDTGFVGSDVCACRGSATDSYSGGAHVANPCSAVPAASCADSLLRARGGSRVPHQRSEEPIELEIPRGFRPR